VARAVRTGETLAVEGYRELLRGLREADRTTRLEVRATLRHAGEAVQADARSRLLEKKERDQRTAAGYRIRVRQRGIAVEQALRKTTGLHPEWGAWQMRHALVPALGANRQETNRLVEAALEEIAAHVNRIGGV